MNVVGRHNPEGNPRRRRGALLLEVLIALAVFVGAGLAVISVLEQSTGAMGRMRDQRQACDLACSAMARIEAGIDTPETLDGPVPAWEEGSDGGVIQGGGGGNWELDIRTDTSQFPGLTRITVQAIKRPGTSGSDAVQASYSLTQLVKAGAGAMDDRGTKVDEIGEKQRRAAEKKEGVIK